MPPELMDMVEFAVLSYLNRMNLSRLEHSSTPILTNADDFMMMLNGLETFEREQVNFTSFNSFTCC